MCLYLKNFPCTLLMELRPLVCNTALSSHIQVITVTYFRLDCGLVSAELESSTPHKASHTVNCTSRTSKEHESCAFFKTGRDRDSCRKDTFVSGRPLKIFQDSKWAELKHFMRIQWPIWEVLSKATCKSLGRLHYTHRLKKKSVWVAPIYRKLRFYHYIIYHYSDLWHSTGLGAVCYLCG